MKNIFKILIVSILLFSCVKQEVPEINLEKLQTENAKKIVSSNNNFAFNFIKIVNQNDLNENWMVSPLSISFALSMTYNGAENATLDAFDKVLGYQMSLIDVNQFNMDLINYLKSNSNGSVMEIANSIWMDQNFPVKQDFVNVNKEYYFAEVKNLDFKNPTSVNTINNWVSTNTHTKIPKILDQINPTEVMFLINAIYFKALWKNSFDIKNTVSKPFYVSATETLNVPTMHLNTEFDYLKNELFSSIVIPYKNDKFSMVILLPNNSKSIQDVVQQLNQENWNNWLQKYSKSKLSISFPKFKLEYENLLNNELIDMGLGIAFTENADFRKMSELSLNLTKVLHKTFIEVNESGTEAAAVTVVGVGITSVGPDMSFDINRPFIYVIKENVTGAICFIGKVEKPNI